MMEALAINVGHTDIDAIHRELSELVKKIATAHDMEFDRLYSSLLEHTEAHFQHEEKLMREAGFLHTAEHVGEHHQMLNEMRQFGQRSRPLARSYVQQRLPERFALHISRMDSLLVAYLRSLN